MILGFLTFFLYNEYVSFSSSLISLTQVIAEDMKMTYFMDGSVNGHDFTIEGEGDGKPYE